MIKEQLQHKDSVDMCNGPLLKKMLLFAIPIMLSSVLQLLFNAVDIMVVSRYAGDNAMAAVGSNGALISLMVNMFLGLSIGVNVVAGQEQGARAYDELCRTVHTSMLVGLLGGIFMMLFGEAFTQQILTWMQVPLKIRDLTEVYLRIYFLGLPANMVYNFGAALLRSVGETKRPMYYLTVAGVTNVVLNLLFVIVFYMDVAGVAVATVISQMISAVLVVRCMMQREDGTRLNLCALRIHLEKLKAILKVGLPAGIHGISSSFSNVAIQSSINSFGEVVVAACSASANIESFIQCGCIALNNTTLTFVSQNLGAKKVKRIPKVVMTGLVCTTVMCLVLAVLCLTWGHILLGIYTDTEVVIQAGMERFRYTVTGYLFCGLLNIMVGAQRGMGYSVAPMAASMIGACGLRLLWLSTVFQIPAYHTIQTVYMCFPFSWALTFVIQFACWGVIMWQVWRKQEKHPESTGD